MLPYILTWSQEKWKKPTITNNFYFEIDFGKISLFLCRGKNHKDLCAVTHDEGVPL